VKEEGAMSFALMLGSAGVEVQMSEVMPSDGLAMLMLQSTSC